MKIYVPPIKSQGIKTKLVPWIKSIVPEKKDSRWIEPFMGTGVVGFNMNAFNSFIMSDTNPHLINFYNTLKNKKINSLLVKEFLQNEGEKLKNKGSEYYYEVRERFNKSNSPLDFLFLNRSCFNGIIRFNRKGKFNVPYCHKDNRFSQSYITKIINQVKYVQDLLLYKDFTFNYLDFSKTISIGGENDIIYCDPPYISRYSDYFNGWNEVSEQELAKALKDTSSNFILSTWYKNKYRENEYIKSIWNKYNIITKEHFYHIGGKEKNRNSMLEALITNFDIIEKSINNKNDNQEKLLHFMGL